MDIVETYVFDYNQFISPGGKIYCGLNFPFETFKTNKAQIAAVTNSSKNPRLKFLQPAHSNSTLPVQMGTFTGSTKSMVDSPNFSNTLKKCLN